MNYERIGKLVLGFVVGWCINRIGTLLLDANTQLTNANSTLNDLEKAVARLEQKQHVPSYERPVVGRSSTTAYDEPIAPRDPRNTAVRKGGARW